MSDDEKDALSDGTISFEEYEAAVMRFRECMEANGTPIGNFRHDKETRLYDWTVQETYFDNPGAQACEAALALIDRLWQTQVAAEREPAVSQAREQRRSNIVECMRHKGAKVAEDLSYGEVMQWASNEFPECVDAEFTK